jgi:hypothetical protein
MRNIKMLGLIIAIVVLMAPVMLFAQDGNGGGEYVIPGAVMAVVGALSPILIGWVVRQVPQSWARYLIAMVISAVFGFLGILIFEPLEMSLTHIAIIIPAFMKWSDTAYRLWWHNLLKK